MSGIALEAAGPAAIAGIENEAKKYAEKQLKAKK